MDQSNTMKWVVVVVALVVGGGIGYYYGNVKGIDKGVIQQKAVEEARKKEAEQEAAKAVNPFNQAANPFEKVPTNPFEGVKVNPFK